jgi:geranylgeranyl pyrophosphate synthase
MNFIEDTLMELDLSKIHPVLRDTAGHAISSGGKRLRPLICILSAEMVGGDYKSTRETFLALELIHNATLVHDDIIDEDIYRRGLPAVHITNGVKKAVLTGDALLSMGLKYASKTGNPEVVNWLSETSLKMVQGIALQSIRKGKISSEEEYLYMNYLKSGSLFEAAAALGGVVGSGNPEHVKQLADFGKYFGNAYQIRDDIIDAFTLNGSDKKSKNDLLNGDASLLLIYALESTLLPDSDKQKLLSIYNGETEDLNIPDLRRIYEKTGALQKSLEKMRFFSEQSKQCLSDFKDCESKKILYSLLEQYNYGLEENLILATSKLD